MTIEEFKSQDAIAASISRIYEKAGTELAQEIAKRFDMSAPDFGLNSWKVRKLAEMGMLTKSTAKIMTKYSFGINDAVDKAITEQVKEVLKYLEPKLRKARTYLSSNATIRPMADRIKRTVEALRNQAENIFNLINETMITTTAKAYASGVEKIAGKAAPEASIAAIMVTDSYNKAVAETELGVKSARAALAPVLKEISDKGISGFIDKAGRRWSPEAYSDLVMRSTMARVRHQACKDRLSDYGADIYYAVVKFPSRPLCAEWQGKLLSRSGREYDVEDLNGDLRHVFPESRAVGEPAGLWGCNCGHTPAVFFPGLSEVSEPSVTMNAKENDEAYALTQTERALERNVRQAKKNLQVLDKAGFDKDSKEFQQASATLRKATDEYKQFLKDQNIAGITGRTSIYGFDSKLSGKARSAYYRYTHPVVPPTPAVGAPAKAVKAVAQTAKPAAQAVAGSRVVHMTDAELRAVHAKYKNLENWDDHAKKYSDDMERYSGLSKADLDEYKAGMQKVFDSNDYCMRMRERYLEEVYNSHFKNQFEFERNKRHSGGYRGEFTLHDGRARQPKSLYKSDVAYFVNNNLPGELEKYGYLANFDKVKRNDSAGQYGDVVIKFNKNTLRGRMSFTSDDSLGTYYAAGMPENVTLAGIDSTDVQRALKAMRDYPDQMDDAAEWYRHWGYGGYIELQYNGTVTIQDNVEEMMFTKGWNGSEEFKKKLLSHGIKLWEFDSNGKKVPIK